MLKKIILALVAISLIAGMGFAFLVGGSGMGSVERYSNIQEPDEKMGMMWFDSLNVSNPSSDSLNVRFVGSCDIPGQAYDVAVSGSYAYVAGGNAGLRIINVSNPSAPFETGYYEIPGSAFAEGVTVSGSYAYVAYEVAGLRIINVSNPSNPYQTGYYDTPGHACDVTVSGSYAYVADQYAGLRIINVSNPSAPFETGYYNTPSEAWGITVSGSYAYVANGVAGLRIINVSNPSAPFETGYYDTPEWAWDVAVSGSYAYVADWYSGLRIVDVSNPSAPFETGYYYTGYAYDVTVSGSYAYVADMGYGLRIIDVSNPSAPIEVGYYYNNVPHGAMGVAVSGAYAYVAAWNAGLQIYEFLGVGIEETSKGIVYPAKLRLLQNLVQGSFIPLMLQSNTAAPIEIELYNILGQRVRTYKFSSLQRGENRLSLNVQGICSGVYFLKVNGNSVAKVVKLN